MSPCGSALAADVENVIEELDGAARECSVRGRNYAYTADVLFIAVPIINLINNNRLVLPHAENGHRL